MVGNLTSKVNPRGKTTSYTYDDLGRLVEESDPLSQERTYAYDVGGRLTSRTNAQLDQIDYTYNDRNELTRIDYPGLAYVSFAYNDAGARTQMVDGTGTTTYAYDDLYRLTSVTFPGSRTVGYAYDDAGRRTSMTYPGGTDEVTYGYDNANRLSSVTDWNSNAIAYAYDDAGRMTTKTLPSGTGVVSAYTYDNADRLTEIEHVKGGTTTLASVAYTLDDVGNRTQRVDQQGTHTYAYDDLYRLTSVTYPGPSTTTYEFDAFGNRESMTVGADETTYAYDDADRLTSVDPPAASPVAYTWDDNGSLTARGSDSFAWDYEERMTSATVNSVTTTFAYRGDGLRDSRTTNSVTTTFTWDIASGLPALIDDGSRYVYGAGLEAMVDGADPYYYLADGLGSTMAIVDDTGTVQKSYTYDVYGKATATGTLANEFDFAGQQTDPTGLQYLRARYMDPETGVFLSRDPLAASPLWTWPAHGYANGNPSNLADPEGTVPCSTPDCTKPTFQPCSRSVGVRCSYDRLPGFNNYLVSYWTKAGNLVYEMCKLNDEKSDQKCAPFANGSNVWDKLYDLYKLYDIISLFPLGSLKILHGEDALSRASIEYWRKKSTAEILEHLREQPIKVRPDGTVIDGNHRLTVLRERGIDIDNLNIPKEIIPKITFPDP
ncbi:MAG: RHS repeat-associated core domain-containing protein [Dehalococcoidia bacterium]